LYLHKTCLPFQATQVLILKSDCRDSMMVHRDMDPLAAGIFQGA